MTLSILIDKSRNINRHENFKRYHPSKIKLLVPPSVIYLPPVARLSETSGKIFHHQTTLYKSYRVWVVVKGESLF